MTGGAGYIGSHVVKLLGETSHHNIVVVDNLSTGNRSSVLYGSFVQADLADAAVLDELFGNHQFDAVIHFAASIVVPESVEKPISYYQNNTVNTIALIDRSIRAGVKNFIFLSTAAVYGEPEQQLVPVDESCPTIPINPYVQ